MIPLCFSYFYWLNNFFYGLLIFLFLLKFSFNYQFSYLGIFFGYDLLSFLIILLRFFICFLILIARSKIYLSNFYYIIFNFTILILLFSLIMTFSSINFFVFYLFFEVSLIPTLFLIIGWGYQPERLQAGLYLLFYTIFASLPILSCIFLYYFNFGRLVFYYLNSPFNSLIYFFCMNFVFFVKIPIFFVHLWLPKAHVEAPVSGSMILAGVILKLGGYGLIRVLPIFSFINFKFNYIFISISLVGGFIVSLICLRQRDLKSLIAYSSVAHMSLLIGGLITYRCWGLFGSLSIMLAHGLCSSGLFCISNINYERLSRRRIFLNKGLLNYIPSLTLWWFLLCSSNIAAPPSLNLLSEIMIINRLVGWSYFSIIFIIFISFFRAAYSLFLYSCTQHGKIYLGLFSFNTCFVREYLLLFIHWFPLNLIFLKSDLFTLWLYLNSLIKILVCGAGVISIILNYFYLLYLFFIIFFT